MIIHLNHLDKFSPGLSKNDIMTCTLLRTEKNIDVSYGIINLFNFIDDPNFSLYSNVTSTFFNANLKFIPFLEYEREVHYFVLLFVENLHNNSKDI